MNIRIFKQAWKLFGQNPFFALLSLLGTALTIAFVMTVYMMYYMRAGNLGPEPNRSRIFYSGPGFSHREDMSDGNGGMSRHTAHFLYDSIPLLEKVTYYVGISKLTCCDLSGQNEGRYSLRGCDREWFNVFDYTFVAGRPFNEEEEGARRRVAVVTESLARNIFQTTDVIGKEILLNFYPTQIVGVVKPVSNLFVTAYADVWTPISSYYNDARMDRAGGIRGPYQAVLVRKPGVSEQELRDAVEQRVDRFNANHSEYIFKTYNFRTHKQQMFLQESAMSPTLVFVLLMGVLLIVPAINISGLVQSHIRNRMEEIGIRKAYGASTFSIFNQFVAENLSLTLTGGILGYVIACLVVVLGGSWMFGSADLRMESGIMNLGLFFTPSLFLMVLFLCVLFNVLSVMIPVWLSVRRPITEIIQGE